MVPVGSELATGLFGEQQPAEAAAAVRPEGAFKARIDDEGLKVNAQLDGLMQGGRLGPPVHAIHQLVCDPAWDPIFTREDARGQRISREDLLVHLRDWVDEDAESSGLVASFGATSCATMPAAVPFEKAFGDENQPYDRGEDRYRAKNARLDSLDELYLVAGVGDAFMAAFGDALTVYLPRDAKQNVNELSRRGLVQLAARMADPPLQPALLDPVFAERLEVLVAQLTYGGLVSITPGDLGRLVQAAGVTVNQATLTGANSPYTDRSTTFRIRAAGTAGDVEKTIDAVVRLVKAQPGQPLAAPGQLVYWREE
jgi:general secretion pathway protein K